MERDDLTVNFKNIVIERLSRERFLLSTNGLIQTFTRTRKDDSFEVAHTGDYRLDLSIGDTLASIKRQSPSSVAISSNLGRVATLKVRSRRDTGHQNMKVKWKARIHTTHLSFTTRQIMVCLHEDDR